MSGLYPNSAHVKDLADILYNKVNPVNSDNPRWTYNHPEVVHPTGKIPDLQLFDAQFFKVHYRLANSMDAMGRKILEQAYQAIYDAGISPEHLCGKKIGVYIGTCFSETEKVAFYVLSSVNGFGMAGCSKTMFANRISYWLDVKGPSMSIDQGCNSSLTAVELAHNAIVSGECDAAIVGGTDLCLHPHSSVHYGRIMKLSKEGKIKSFDENAEGFAKSEAINVLFLQKAKNALRVYAEIVHVKTEFTAQSILEDEAGIRYSFCRNLNIYSDFLKGFYKEAKVPVNAVEYVEAYGSAVPEADKSELMALENVFCNGRSDPLLVGSVMSNLGYGGAASGITAITKVLLGYHTGELAANLHCESPRRDVAALRDGRMRVVRDHTRFGREYTAVNGLSVTGTNAHVLLHGRYKPKDLSRYKSNIPHIVLVSGRQETAVQKVFNYLKTHPIDPEELALLNNIHISRISGNLGRGYIILDKNKANETVSLSEKVVYFDYVKRPLWFVYSGMGSQWAGMGAALMSIPIFAAAIERCHRVLKPKGLDIVHIITSPDKTIFDNILHSFVGIAAIQIGLTDILREIGLVPDKIIGHSVGELGCAYADGCFTAEEMILSAYSRGLVSVQTPFIRGSMAAVGIGYQKIITMCPPEIEVACHNSPDSCTISGPIDAVHKFVKELESKDIFAKEVMCSNIAYHSRYIADAGPKLLEYLGQVIKTPKVRSQRWLSTSVPMYEWKRESAKYSSAEYHTNNLLNPVLFEETCAFIPSNAILVEVAPHGLLQAILNRSLPATCKNIPLTRRGHPDNSVFLLEAIGKLYMEGFNPKVQTLYPKIDFPVSTGTPMLSHLVEWAHNEIWDLPLYASALRKTAAAAKYVISLHDDEHAYLLGHVIRGKVLYPFSAVLVAVWDTLAMCVGAARRRLAVRLRDVALHAQPALHDRRQLRLAVALHRATGRFEVLDDVNSKVASGFIYQESSNNLLNEEVETNDLEISSKEIYNNFFLRDVCYKDSFQSIHSVNSSLTKARIMWRDNWVTFIDGMIQLNTLRHSHESYSIPNFISKLCIDPKEHDKHKHNIMTATVLETHYRTRCGGVLMENITFRDIPLSTANSIKLRALRFIQHFGNKYNFETILQVYLQIVLENIAKNKVNIIGIYDNENTLSKFTKIKRILEDVPGIIRAFKCLQKKHVMEEPDKILSKVDLVLCFNLSTDNDMGQTLYRALQNNTFVINIQEDVHNFFNTACSPASYRVVCGHRCLDTAYVELARWRLTNTTNTIRDSCVVTVVSQSDLALVSQKRESLLPQQTLLILTSYPAVPGLKDLVRQFKQKPGCIVRLVMSNDEDSKGIDAESLINVDLIFNVLKNSEMGGEYYVPLQDVSHVNHDKILQSALVGQMDSLRWVQANPQQQTGVTVEVHYAGFNNLDIKRAIGLIPIDKNCVQKTDCSGYGMDFSGITESGIRVMGLVYNGAVSSRVQADPEMLWPVPAHWTLQDAATVPLAYCLAYYCLTFHRGLYPGMDVLVHGGAGALGQAVISIALSNDCNVFATVSDVRKKRFLLKLFPGLKAENIGNSRDITFCDMVLNATQSKGVEIIICCVNGELKNASLKCLASMGYIIDVAQIPHRETFDFGMYHLTKNRSYIPVNIFSILNEKGHATMKRLQRLVCEGVSRGWVRPLSRVTYAPLAAPRALRLLAAAAQRGRVLLRTQPTHSLCVQPILQCSRDEYHVLITDHEHFGKQLTDKLISRGVRHIRLLIHEPLSPKDLVLKIRQWQSIGVQVSCETFNDSKNVLKLFTESSLRPVEGIYIIITKIHTSSLEPATFIEKMDILARTLHPKMKYFAVINTVSSTGEETCMRRSLSNFAGTMIKLPELLEIDGRVCEVGDGRVSVREAAEAAERALTAALPALVAHAAPAAHSSLLQQIAAVAEVTLTQDTEATTTLYDLGMNSTKCNDVWVFLRDTYNIYLTMEEIQTLTIQRIKDIDETITLAEYDNEKGLKTLFSYVDTDELQATTEMLFLPTLINSDMMRDDEIDMSYTHLCIVPGVEGHRERFRALCERLKLPALVLQPGLDQPHETVQEMAHRYAKILLRKANLKNTFYLLGYESGALVALEIAAILEDNGLTGVVYCIGNPDEMKTDIKKHLNELETDEALQDAIVRHIFDLMTKNGNEDLELALRGVTSWQEKINITVRALLGRVSHSAQYVRQLIEAVYGRIAAVLRYEVKPRALRSRLVLLQPRSPQPLAAHAAALQPHSLQPVAAHELRAPLAHAAHDLRCAAIINTYLSPDILEDFKNKNLCESYLLNANSIMKNCS
ncbi:fatty acid synthase-like [Epargyreus clarus]|uniref:fatty acid synthase-like n=1 Tax=Epargyreus clarus TaxID=520877 RepID=UPI003C2EF292